MKKLLYIHGYNGSPEGSSCQLFRKYMPQDRWQVIGMDYNQEDCAVALRQIRETIEREQIDLVVGSSLGGFLTLLTTGIKRIVINPCYSPSVELPKLGPHNGLPAPSEEMVATYAALEPQLKTFTDEERNLITGYFADNDELMGDQYKEAFREDIGVYLVINSGHHVSETAVKKIISLMEEMYYKKDFDKTQFQGYWDADRVISAIVELTNKDYMCGVCDNPEYKVRQLRLYSAICAFTGKEWDGSQRECAKGLTSVIMGGLWFARYNETDLQNIRDKWPNWVDECFYKSQDNPEEQQLFAGIMFRGMLRKRGWTEDGGEVDDLLKLLLGHQFQRTITELELIEQNHYPTVSDADLQNHLLGNL